MLIRRVFAAFVIVLLFAGTVYAFPHDPNPSTINSVAANQGGFPGDWTNSYGSFNRNNTRLFQYMINVFNTTGGGPGGAKDLKIWNTPTFTNPAIVNADRDAWEYMLDNPGASVPTSVARAIITRHDEMIDFIEKLPRTNLTVEYLGEIPRGFPFPVLVFSKNADRTPAGLAATGKPLVWAQGNIHGGEWSGGESNLAMAYDLAHGRYDDLLDKINVILVPRICADGAKQPIRTTNDLVALQWTAAPSARDLNRDNLLLDLPVQRALGKMRYAYFPHFISDMHERSSSSIAAGVTNTFGILTDWNTNDVGASGTIVPQAGKEVQNIRYDIMETDLNKLASEYGLTFGWYTEGADTYYLNSTSSSLTGTINNYSAGGIYADANLSNSMVMNQAWDPDAPYLFISEADYNPRTANNITAFPGIVVQLFENKSGPSNIGGKAMWARRVATGYVCILSAMTTAANRPDVVAQIEQIRKNNVEKGKTVSTSDMIPIKYHSPKPVWFTEAREWPIVDLDLEYTNAKGNDLSPRDMTNITMYDAKRALQKVAAGTGYNGGDYIPVKGSGSAERQFFKVTYNWKTNIVAERIRPYAYLIEGPYANELVTRMMLAGIEVKRLASDVTIDVEGWSYNARTPTTAAADQGGPVVDTTDSGAGGWRNRDVTIIPKTGRLFKKDTFVVYLAQRMNNLIPMYLEPDMPWNVGSVIFLTNMSAALGGPANGWLSPLLIGMEMPAYRYLKEVDLPTYDVDHFHPFINRGAVARFYSYHTQDDIAKVAADSGQKSIKVFDYDIHVHTRTDALVGGKFDMALQTSENNIGYLILGKNGAYQKLEPHSTMFGWNVATIVIAEHGLVPFTVDLDPTTGNPKVEEGNVRALPRALPATDDLIGVRIVEIIGSPILKLFKDAKLPPNAEATDKGIQYTDLFAEKGVLLSDSMLDGWRIVGVTPQSGTGWKVNVVNGEVVVTFTKDVFDDQTVTVTLQKIGTSETTELEIIFAGEHKNIIEKILDEAGCNAGVTLLAFLVLCPLFIRRKN